jgi:hypothetical protein
VIENLAEIQANIQRSCTSMEEQDQSNTDRTLSFPSGVQKPEENSQAQTIDNNDKENEDHSTMRTLHEKNRPMKTQYSLAHQDTTESTDGITNGCPRQLRQPLETIDTNKPNYPTILPFATANPNNSVASSITSSTEHGGGQNIGNRNVSKRKRRRAAHVQKLRNHRAQKIALEQN